MTTPFSAGYARIAGEARELSTNKSDSDVDVSQNKRASQGAFPVEPPARRTIMGTESSNEKTKSFFDWVEFDGGRAKFDGWVRGCDELGHATFAVELPGREVLYGEFDARFEPDKTHFNIEIVRFGNPNRNEVDLDNYFPHCSLTPEVKLTLERIITALMVRDAGRAITIHAENFLGKVFFRPGWLQVRPR